MYLVLNQFNLLLRHETWVLKIPFRIRPMSLLNSVKANYPFTYAVNIKPLILLKRPLSSINNQQTITSIHNEWLKRFKENEIPDPELSIRVIIEHVMNSNECKDNIYNLNQDIGISEDEEKQIGNLCQCRLARMPVQYIIREWDFRELRLLMCPPVFIPRPETEQLVELVLKASSAKNIILDIGCGTGAICLSLLKALPEAQVIAIDQSQLACQLTLENAQLNNLGKNLQVVHSKLNEDGSLSAPLALPISEVDILVSNPPYVPSALIVNLQPEIKLFEDLRALEAGRDGLRVIKSLLRLAQTQLKSGALVFLEVDSSHPKFIEKWLIEHPELSIKFVKTYKDYFDRDRFIVLEKL